MKKILLAYLCPLVLCGCVTHVDMPVLPATHPANPESEMGLLLAPSELLSRHHPPPDTAPQEDPAQHDHMQQDGHGMSGNESMSDMKGMDHGGMEHGPRGQSDATHDHATENQGPVTGSMTGTDRSGRIYRCPIHTGETSSYVGNCSKCGKPLEEAEAAGESIHSGPMDAATKKSAGPYLCTMHPKLSLSSPGLCPVCGMTLIERKEGEK